VIADLNSCVLGPYDAVYVFGSAGCGKSQVLKRMRALGEQCYGREATAHCANSGRVAVNVDCQTFGKRLQYGKHRPWAARPYTDISVARDVGGIKLLLVEEATAIPSRLFNQHVNAVKTAQEEVNRSVNIVGLPQEFTAVSAPIHGMKLVATGDYLQQIVPGGGVGMVKDDGTYAAYVPHVGANNTAWKIEALQHPNATVLIVIAHGNHRLLSKMFVMLNTGCDFQLCSLFDVFIYYTHPSDFFVDSAVRFIQLSVVGIDTTTSFRT